MQHWTRDSLEAFNSSKNKNKKSFAMKLHPLCKLFPEITGDDFNTLVADIKSNGLREPITTLDGMILDGQNRYNACIASGIKPKFDTFTGKKPIEFVISKNLSRRHLNESQRAMLAAEISLCRNSDTTLQKAAKTLNVSRDSVQKAAAVKKASRSLTERVKSGKIKLNAAHEKVHPKKKSPLPNPIIPPCQIPPADPPEPSNPEEIIDVGFIMTPADFQKRLDALEKLIPADADHKKFGIIANNFVNRQMNFSTGKKEFNPYGRN